MVDRSLIFDVGCNDGQDADFYLKKGFRVVEVEANPALCEALKKRFADEIAEAASCSCARRLPNRRAKSSSTSTK